jgi:hypothetical protein
MSDKSFFYLGSGSGCEYGAESGRFGKFGSGFGRFYLQLAEPKSQDAIPRFNPGFILFHITNAGGKSRIKPWVWRPEMWALHCVILAKTAGPTSVTKWAIRN